MKLPVPPTTHLKLTYMVYIMMILKKADAQIVYENVIKFSNFSYEDNIGIIPAGMQFYQKKVNLFPISLSQYF